MIAAMQDVLVRNRAEFELLPDEGFWEVVEGRAILLPPPELDHQDVELSLLLIFSEQLKHLGYGYVVAAVNVFVPPPRGSLGEVQSRVPDLIVAWNSPAERFELGEPPDLVIEILLTRRGNVERTEKLDDYARGGIGEYWIVNPSLAKSKFTG
ncbi:MAG: Uma2 family endonuclease [Acidobacteriota bacterium]|nr:Uma2 family endonuclease [Acidobacteriota bacterium]